MIIGENRTFDHIFATYKPVHKDEKVLNLLSKGIVKEDGTPGLHYGKAPAVPGDRHHDLSERPDQDRSLFRAAARR